MAEFYNIPQYSNPMLNDFTQSIDQQAPADQTELQRALLAREQMLADRQRQTQVQQGLIDENQILASPRTAQGGLQRAGGDVLGAQALVAQDVGRKPWEALFPAPPIGRTPQELNLQQTQIPGGKGNLLDLKEALTAGKGLSPEGMNEIGRGLGLNIFDKGTEAAMIRAQARDSTLNQPLKPEQASKLWKFNPQTRDFDPVPPEMMNLPPQELTKQGFRVYSDKQRGVVEELKDTDIAFQQLKSAVADIRDKGALGLFASELTGGNVGGPEGAVFKKASTNFTTIFDKFLGGVRGAASPQMQAIRSKVLPSITSTGQVSDILMNDLQELIQQMGDSRLRTVVGNQQFNATPINQAADKVLADFGRTVAPAKPAAGGWSIRPK